jgi:hypothetical protein
MNISAYKIIPEPEVEKTRLEYRFNREELDKLRSYFSEVKSTEIYPSFNPDYRYTVNFYSTESYFIKKLNSYCRRKLTPGIFFFRSGGLIWRIGLYLLIFFFLLYFVFNFLEPLLAWLLTALDLVTSHYYPVTACAFGFLGIFKKNDEQLRKAKILSRTRPFENCTARELKTVADVCGFQEMEPGDMLVKKGDEGRGLYVLETGQVSVMFKEEGEVVTKIGAGDFFGEMALLDEKPRAATVSCDAPGRLLFLSRRDFFKLLRENQKLAAKILFALSHTLSNRLRKTNLSLEDELTEE